ncbi:unnamed protein product [Parascedosporium putredinis]|uniref:BZIP domain-containing protein n=1 Tax=Parascedosporium putredinis TaxID=1442378 RepID=A0A9P1H8K8_9PEZI|nr:unnamed protein product [Parascedosporium putredinis]CAI7999909.1 unnamed protein product [Parascedosporium putredinis]
MSHHSSTGQRSPPYTGADDSFPNTTHTNSTTNQRDPADRRRTQIRLAQRAYRNRKETAIQTLEKKVNVLQDTNEEMSKAFMNLYDTALSHGLLSAAPEFGRQLQATTEKFVALARKMSDDASSRDGDQALENESDGLAGSVVAHLGINISRGSGVHGDSGGKWRGDECRLEQKGSDSNRTASTLEARGEASSQRNDPSVPFGYQFPNKSSGARSGVEKFSGNASYPFAAAPLPPFRVFPVPSSYSYLERTFGRRIQRATLEQALVLLNMPSPPRIYAAVFGFCLLFQSREKIIQRVTDCISRHNRQTLDNWKFPFFHLGGAGSFFNLVSRSADSSDVPTTDSGSTSGDSTSASASASASTRAGAPSSSDLAAPLLGNQDTQGPHKPSPDANFAMGPFDALVEETRDIRMDERMRMTVPGFQDFVTVNIDPDDFSLDSIRGTTQQTPEGFNYFPSNNQTEADNVPSDDVPMTTLFQNDTILDSILAPQTSVSLSDPLFFHDFVDPFAPDTGNVSIPLSWTPQPKAPKTKQRVSLNVEKFVVG